MVPICLFFIPTSESSTSKCVPWTADQFFLTSPWGGLVCAEHCSYYMRLNLYNSRLFWTIFYEHKAFCYYSRHKEPDFARECMGNSFPLSKCVESTQTCTWKPESRVFPTIQCYCMDMITHAEVGTLLCPILLSEFGGRLFRLLWVNFWMNKIMNLRLFMVEKSLPQLTWRLLTLE